MSDTSSGIIVRDILTKVRDFLDKWSGEMGRADRQRWESARTLGDLGELTAQWLEGRIASQPGYAANTGPDPETTELIPVLAQLNRAGYVAFGSQPGWQGRSWDGWVWQQRAEVSGLADDGMLARIKEVTQYTDLIVIPHRLLKYRWFRSPWEPCEEHERGICCNKTLYEIPDGIPGCGSRMTRREIALIYGEIGDEAYDAVLNAWHVTVIDPVWQRNDVLWPTFATLPSC